MMCIYIYIMMCTLTNNIDLFVEWEARQPNRDASCVTFLSIILSIYNMLYIYYMYVYMSVML